MSNQRAQGAGAYTHSEPLSETSEQISHAIIHHMLIEAISAGCAAGRLMTP